MKIRDRIKELRRVPANQLQPNPRNWRTHPKSQRDALRALLAEVGYADAMLARELPDGGLQLIDGHLRAETTPDCVVPVLVLDVDQIEADRILLTLDPLAAMAEPNAEQLDELLRECEFEHPVVEQMLAELANRADVDKRAPDAAGQPEINLPETYQVLVDCEDEDQQQNVYHQLKREGLRCRLLTL